MADGYEIIAAPDLPRLALTAWRCRVGEAGMPDLPDAVIDGLYLAGHDPVELARRGLPLGELSYLAGVSEPAGDAACRPAPATGEVIEWAATDGPERGHTPPATQPAATEPSRSRSARPASRT